MPDKKITLLQDALSHLKLVEDRLIDVWDLVMRENPHERGIYHALWKANRDLNRTQDHFSQSIALLDT